MTKKILERYLKKQYDENMSIIDLEGKNQAFDIVGNSNSLNMRIEYKSRYFITGKNDRYLHKNDILIEFIQGLPYLQYEGQINNTTVNSMFKSQKLNTAIGWFYKCNADRLIYIRYLDGKFYDLFDIEFRLFKDWLLNNMIYQLQYTGTTTGTINLELPISEIPPPLIYWFRLDNNKKVS